MYIGITCNSFESILYLCTVGARSDLRRRAIVYDVHLQSEQRVRNQRDTDSVQF